MPVIVGVTLRKTKDILQCDSNDLDLKLGDRVVVETENGWETGLITERERMVDKTDKNIGKVLRVASAEDEKRLRENQLKLKDTMKIVLEKINRFELNMKLICLDYTYDRSKLFIYYTADTRVDFRELIKELGVMLKTRIQMVQIGVRDATQIIGGVGPCGRILCCCKFLKEFKPCTIEMAREQDVPINIAKLSGMCGRLMCCLNYEHDSYVELRQNVPPLNIMVNTPEGKAKVKSVAVLAQEVTVEFSDQQTKKFKISQISGFKK